jgi:hypothetical protein
MKTKYIIGLICAFCISCKEDTQTLEYSSCDNGSYKQGQVIVGLNEGVNLEESFNIISSYGFTVFSVGGNEYESTLPIENVVDYLNTKNYINYNGLSAYKTYLSTVAFIFWNMTDENQKDWIETKSILKLTDISTISRYLVISVPVGQEKKWMTFFKNDNNFSYAQLNCTNQIKPH